MLLGFNDVYQRTSMILRMFFFKITEMGASKKY